MFGFQNLYSLSQIEISVLNKHSVAHITAVRLDLVFHFLEPELAYTTCSTEGRVHAKFKEKEKVGYHGLDLFSGGRGVNLWKGF